MSDDCASDEALMHQVAWGHREAMAPLVRRYASGLLTFLHRMTGDRHRAEELFQETFLALWQNRRRYTHPRPFRPWLFGIAMNKYRASSRKLAIIPALAQLWHDAPAQSAAPTPDEAAMADETASLVAQAVATLPPKQRAVLVLRVWNGMKYSEIAASLDVAEATIRSQMFHALASLRKHLEPRMRMLREDCHDRP